MVCYLSMGSNLGPRARHLLHGLLGLMADGRVRVRRVSRVYETAPVGYAGQGDCLNLCVAGETDLSPEELLSLAHAVEVGEGRERPFPNAPRTLDLDLLLCEGEVRPGPHLTLPHPRMWERQFVLRPLADIAPGLSVGGRPAVGELAEVTDPDVRDAGSLAETLTRER